MAILDLKAVFVPNQRIAPDQYWIALGIVAVIDTIRLTVVAPGTVQTALIPLLVLTIVHLNRLRDAGRPLGYVALPLLLGMAGKIIVAMAALFMAMLPVLEQFLAERGIDIEDTEAVNAAAAQPGFQADLQAYMTQDPELALQLAQAMAWPSHWGFWIAVALIGRWFVRLPSR